MIICSILPADHYRWRPDVESAESILQMNEWLKTFAAKRKLVYMDYYDALADAQGGMKEGFSIEGVHPTPAGYDTMAPDFYLKHDSRLYHLPQATGSFQ